MILWFKILFKNYNLKFYIWLGGGGGVVFEKFMVHAPLSKFRYQKANLEAQIGHLYGPPLYLGKNATLSYFYCLGFRNEKLFHFLTLSDVKLIEIYNFDFSLNFVFFFLCYYFCFN